MNKRLLIFASGRGSNAEAIYQATMNGTVRGTVVGVICDHKEAAVLERAKRWG
ncbi:MAG: formyltransferase family protein, partial [Dialister sp.]|nr:formyltransferase family protein [Dialister sp.]